MRERDEIELRFRANLARVDDLIDLYETIALVVPGKKLTKASDILRAAVVLLHATLKDLLRSLAGWKLPASPAASLRQVPLAGTDREKFT